MGNVITFNVSAPQKKIIRARMGMNCHIENGSGDAMIRNILAPCSGSYENTAKWLINELGITLSNFTLVLKKSIWEANPFVDNTANWFASYDDNSSLIKSRSSADLQIGTKNDRLGYKAHNTNKNVEFPISNVNDKFKLSLGAVYNYMGNINSGESLDTIYESLILSFTVKETEQEFDIVFT